MICMMHKYSEGTTTYLVGYWDAEIFLAVADCKFLYSLIVFSIIILIIVVMVLRVYAMWNRSKKIFYSLLLIYVPQVMVSLILTGISRNPNTYLQGMSGAKIQTKWQSHADFPCSKSFPLVTSVRITDFSICEGFSNAPSSIYFCDAILRLLLSAALLILALIQTLKESVQVYKATKKWQSNRYLQLLARDGVLYFLVYVSPFPFFHSIHYHILSPISVLCTCIKTNQLDIYP